MCSTFALGDLKLLLQYLNLLHSLARNITSRGHLGRYGEREQTAVLKILFIHVRRPRGPPPPRSPLISCLFPPLAITHQLKDELWHDIRKRAEAQVSLYHECTGHVRVVADGDGLRLRHFPCQCAIRNNRLMTST